MYWVITMVDDNHSQLSEIELDGFLSLVKDSMQNRMTIHQKAYFMQEIIDHYRLVCHCMLEDETDKVPRCVK